MGDGLFVVRLTRKQKIRMLVELTRQEAADVEPTLACHRAAPTRAVPNDRLAILVRHVEHGIVGNVDSLPLKHDLVVIVARLNDCLGRPAVKVRDPHRRKYGQGHCSTLPGPQYR